VGGASLVRKNIPPFIKAAREPLTFAGVNSVGLRRRGFSDEEIKTIEDIYRIIYIQNSNVSKALEIVKETIDPSEIRDEIIHFIENSDKGVIRGMI
jgi:UDP-N-acetylglucosamine acyltransferase